MKKIIVLGLFCLANAIAFGQTTTNEQLSAADSLALLTDMMKLLDSANAPFSYTAVSLGIGNRLFSLNNNTLNSKQTSTSSIIYSPSVGYYHKSGFSIAAIAFLLNEKDKGFGVNQFSISPSWALAKNNKFDLGISFTHYFVKDKYSPYSSPIQNDLFASFSYKKPWLQLGTSLGFSTGKYYQVRNTDSAINGIRRRLYDSATFKIKAFTFMLTATHDFEFYKIFTKKDAIIFQPMFMFNMGSSTTAITHKTNAVNLLNFLYRKGKIPKLQATEFAVESLGLNMNVSYAIGKWLVQPEWYLDYYLRNTDGDRFSQVFTVALSYSL